ncbi:MAG: class I SAM-dependent methyltransferase [Candidatus Kapaibacterium sp.]
MKNAVKSLLGTIGLLKAGRVAYSFLKGLSPATIATEFRARGKAGGIAVPPPRLIFYVIGYRWAKTFLDSGKIITDAMIAHLEKNDIHINSFRSILDFGCGCGRLIRHLPVQTKASLYGCDYNEELIEWSQKNLRFAEFKRNELAPPLPYPDNSFDFIYARSVFTHLDEMLQKKWMEELHRVLRPGGYLYFTAHGEQFFDRLSPEEIQKVRSGEIVVFQPKAEGHNICTSFELPDYVSSHLSAGYRKVDYIPGTSASNLQQDAYILQRI